MPPKTATRATQLKNEATKDPRWATWSVDRTQSTGRCHPGGLILEGRGVLIWQRWPLAPPPGVLTLPGDQAEHVPRAQGVVSDLVPFLESPGPWRNHSHTVFSAGHAKVDYFPPLLWRQRDGLNAIGSIEEDNLKEVMLL